MAKSCLAHVLEYLPLPPAAAHPIENPSCHYIFSAFFNNTQTIATAISL